MINKNTDAHGENPRKSSFIQNTKDEINEICSHTYKNALCLVYSMCSDENVRLPQNPSEVFGKRLYQRRRRNKPWKPEETCYHSNSSEKPSASIGVKNSQKSIIIIIIIIIMHQTWLLCILNLAMGLFNLELNQFRFNPRHSTFSICVSRL